MMNYSTLIEFIGDPTCPYCYLGFERFIGACSEISVNSFEVRIRPFIINRDLPASGIPYQEYLISRYGGATEIAKALTPVQQGAEVDQITLSLGKIKHMPNALASLTLIKISDELDLGAEMFLALGRAFYGKGLDIGDLTVLRAQAESLGLDGKAVKYLLQDEARNAHISDEIAALTRHGINQVPAWIIGRHYVVTGIQTRNFWRNVLGEIEEKARS